MLRLRRSLATIAVAISSEIGRDEIYLAAGLALIAAGCWLTWRPGAFLLPGAVLVWIALPCRAAFIDRPQPEDSRRPR